MACRLQARLVTPHVLDYGGSSIRLSTGTPPSCKLHSRHSVEGMVQGQGVADGCIARQWGETAEAGLEDGLQRGQDDAVGTLGVARSASRMRMKRQQASCARAVQYGAGTRGSTDE